MLEDAGVGLLRETSALTEDYYARRILGHLRHRRFQDQLEAWRNAQGDHLQGALLVAQWFQVRKESLCSSSCPIAA